MDWKLGESWMNGSGQSRLFAFSISAPSKKWLKDKSTDKGSHYHHSDFWSIGPRNPRSRTPEMTTQKDILFNLLVLTNGNFLFWHWNLRYQYW